jgi:hypothetical protein
VGTILFINIYIQSWVLYGFITPINLGNNHVNIMGEHRSTIQNAVVAVVPMSKDLGYRLQLEAVLFLQRGIQP